MASMADYDICNSCGSLQKVYPHNGRRLCATCCKHEEDGEDKDAELAALRAELKQARAERDKFHKAFDEAHAVALKWMDSAIEHRIRLDDARDKLKRSRRTIAALVVAVRSVYEAADNWLYQEFNSSADWMADPQRKQWIAEIRSNVNYRRKEQQAKRAGEA